MKTKLISIALVSLVTFVLLAQQQSSSPGSAQPGPRILAKLSEIVSIRERLARNYEQMFEAGRAPAGGLAEIELAEARVELARERGKAEALITELQGLVTVHERRMKMLSALAKDRVPSDDVDRAQAALLEAQVRLLRAQK